MDSSQFPRRLAKTLIISSIVLSVYIGGYALMRWRKVLVRTGVWVAPADRMPDKGDAIVYRIREGRDARTEGVGALKNVIAKPVAVFFAPVCWMESRVWNSM